MTNEEKRNLMDIFEEIDVSLTTKNGGEYKFGIVDNRVSVEVSNDEFEFKSYAEINRRKKLSELSNIVKSISDNGLPEDKDEYRTMNDRLQYLIDELREEGNSDQDILDAISEIE